MVEAVFAFGEMARGQRGRHRVTALHNHMLDDQPHLYFTHFWANNDAGKLTERLKALSLINNPKS